MTNQLEADVILTNANVITMNSNQPSAEAVAVKDGTIVYVGEKYSVSAWKGSKTEIIDVNGKTVMPGFIESHIHPTPFGLNLLELDCRPRETPGINDILKKVKNQAEELPEGEWIRGWGWDDSLLKERRNPTRWELDQVAPNHPVFLKRICTHMAVCNSKALEISRINEGTSNPDGGNIEREKSTGKLTGLVQEKALGMIAIPNYELKDTIKGMKLAQKEFTKWGITTVHDMATEPTDFRIYQEMLSNKELKVRLRPWFWSIDGNGFTGSFDEVLSLGIRSGFGNDMIKIQGMKFMLDGSVGGRTAAVAKPYINDESNRGILYNDSEFLAPYVKQAVEAGLRVAIHGIGERAIEVAIQVFEDANKSIDITKMRNRIEHCALPTEEHLQRLKDLELIAASSIGFIYHIGDSYINNLGSERMKNVYPHRAFKDYGIVAPGNSDLPVTGGNPWSGIYAAVNRKSITGQVLDESQNISVHDAIKAYTYDAAYSSCEEDTIGTIRPNAKADIIIVSDNPYTIDTENLVDIQVETTILNGEIIYSRDRVKI